MQAPIEDYYLEAMEIASSGVFFSIKTIYLKNLVILIGLHALKPENQ